MKITLHTIKVRELVKNYADNDEAGVVGYGGKLDIRPPYQREFCYNDNQHQAVMDTITNNFPLNTMYWVVREDGRYERIGRSAKKNFYLPLCKWVVFSQYALFCKFTARREGTDFELRLAGIFL